MMLRTYFPKSLFWRVLLILVTTLLLLQGVAIWIFFDRHWENITWRLSSLAVGDISYLVHRFEEEDIASYGKIIEDSENYLNMRVRFESATKLSEVVLQESRFYEDAPVGLLREQLSIKIENNFIINVFDKTIEVIVEINGGILYFSFPKKRIFSSTIYVFLFVTLLAFIVLVSLAVLLLRGQTSPILRLTRTMDSFGKGIESGSPLTPRGADEIRSATIAFNRMQERIRRQIRQRTDMLAGVSHDLGTPITRMKLQLELLPESSDVSRLKSDLHDMEAMIKSYLAFAEGEGTERSCEHSLGNILRHCLARWRGPSTEITLNIAADITLAVKVNAMGRCLDNLLANAVRYGDRVSVSLFLHEGRAMIVIDDDGPGIPAEKRDQVFRPFYRLEGSRSRETGGYGLGLAIARDIARVHGGDVTLDDSPLGGVRAIISLPL